jgi:transcriptional regulator with XRE-family HTH domain
LAGVARISGKTDDAAELVRLGDAIRRVRLTASMSQEALADLAELDRSHYGKIERGERNVTLLNLLRIAKALRTSAAQLLREAGL